MHDKKSNHYTSAQGYRDIDGQSKNFTFVDHDVKTSIPTTNYNPATVKKELAEHREKIITQILLLPASLCAVEYNHYTLRGADRDVIEWNETMLRDPSLSMTELYNIYIIPSKRYELL